MAYVDSGKRLSSFFLSTRPTKKARPICLYSKSFARQRLRGYQHESPTSSKRPWIHPSLVLHGRSQAPLAQHACSAPQAGRLRIVYELRRQRFYHGHKLLVIARKLSQFFVSLPLNASITLTILP